MKQESVLLDTSFMIRLLNENDEMHQRAYDYYRGFLEHGISCKISTIAIAEYCVKGKLDQLPLAQLCVVPFNIDHAQKAGEFCAEVHRVKGLRGAKFEQRPVIPNDTKMFSQADTEEDIHYFASFDSEAKKVFEMLDGLNPLFSFIDVRVQNASDYFGELGLFNSESSAEI